MRSSSTAVTTPASSRTSIIDADVLPPSTPTCGIIDADILPTLLIHNLQSPIFQGEPYGLLTSTDIVPGMGLGAAARVGPRVREEVYKALAALNVSHPLSAGAGITGFAAHLSYDAAANGGAQGASLSSSVTVNRTGLQTGQGRTNLQTGQEPDRTFTCPVCSSVFLHRLKINLG